MDPSSHHPGMLLEVIVTDNGHSIWLEEVTLFQHLMVPLDFTDKNIRALNITLDMASHHSSRVTLLHVIESIDLVSEKDELSFYKQLKKNAYEKLTFYAKPFDALGISVQKEVVIGKRVGKILQHAVDHQIDLIILSSHKIDPRDPIEDWGTISYKVAVLSQCPVMLVK